MGKLNDELISILIVDDEPKNLTVLETVLDGMAYRVIRAESADQALMALVAEEFALLILDIRMPDMNGFELAHLIKQRKKNERVPIIFLTAYFNEDQHVLEGYGCGAVDYLHKPVNPTILRSKVAVFAELHRQGRELESANRALVAEIAERRAAQTEMRELNESLERRVEDRTRALLEQMEVEKSAREELRRSEEFNRSLMEGTADSVHVLDLEGRIRHMNGPAMSQFGIATVDPILGKHWWSVWPEESRSVLQRSVEQAHAGAAASVTARQVTPSGTPKWWNVSVTPIGNSAAGEAQGLLAVARDVTEARQTEQALRSSHEQKDKFIATLAHELRNPLAPIRNAVNVMREKSFSDSEMAWCRDVIDRQVGQMTHLLEDLLDVSRITRSRLNLRRELLELATIIEQAVEIARPVLDKAGQSLSMALPADRIAASALGRSSVLGIAVGRTVFLETQVPLHPVLLLHELAHVHQFQRDRAFVIRYAWQTLRHGYRQNRYEVEANAYASARIAASS